MALAYRDRCCYVVVTKLASIPATAAACINIKPWPTTIKMGTLHEIKDECVILASTVIGSACLPVASLAHQLEDSLLHLHLPPSAWTDRRLTSAA